MKKNIREDQLLYESEHSRAEFLVLLQNMIDDGSIRTCSSKTFQLLHDIISKDKKLKKSRPRGSRQSFLIWLYVVDEMNKGMIRKEAIYNAVKQFKVTERTVENALNKYKRRKKT